MHYGIMLSIQAILFYRCKVRTHWRNTKITKIYKRLYNDCSTICQYENNKTVWRDLCVSKIYFFFFSFFPFQVIVRAYDRGNPQLTSTDMIVDFNVIRNIDTPKFQNARYFVTIKDSTPAGTSIFRVTAQDKVRGKLFLHRHFYDT